MNTKIQRLYRSVFELALIREIEEAAVYKNVQAESPLIEIGDYIRSMPLVLKGSIKILREDEDGNTLLLYFLKPGETCAMTLTCCMGHKKSEVKAVAETQVDLLMLPVQKMEEWSRKYKSWRDFVFESYHKRLMGTLQALDNIAFSKLDERLLHYLKTKQTVTTQNELKITHQEIANDLNSSRVVISRLLKKLENKQKVEVKRNSIRLLSI